jgi:hypothetical protein
MELRSQANPRPVLSLAVVVGPVIPQPDVFKFWCIRIYTLPPFYVADFPSELPSSEPSRRRQPTGRQATAVAEDEDHSSLLFHYI